MKKIPGLAHILKQFSVESSRSLQFLFCKLFEKNKKKNKQWGRSGCTIQRKDDAADDDDDDKIQKLWKNFQPLLL